MRAEGSIYLTGKLCFVTLEVKDRKVSIHGSRNGNIDESQHNAADKEINSIILMATKIATEILHFNEGTEAKS